VTPHHSRQMTVLKVVMIDCRYARVWSGNVQGACTTLLSVRVYYIACPSVLVNYANFTETPAGPKMTSIVHRDGACVPHADVGDQRPSYLCKADGSWYYATGSCRCRPGYQPDDDSGTQCTGTDRITSLYSLGCRYWPNLCRCTFILFYCNE